MHRFRPLVIASVLLLAVWSAHADAPDTSTATPGTMVTLQRTTCFGPCPAYRVTLTADGHITFNGLAFVQTQGPVSAQATSVQIAAIVAAIHTADLRSLRDHYTSHDDGCVQVMTDMRGVQITINDVQGSKTVDYYYGCRGAIADQVRPRIEQLARTIDQQLDTARWIGKPAPFKAHETNH
jgi:hypothetical protein